MSALQEAVRRVGQAIDAERAAGAALTEARAELTEARNALRRFAIDPEYDPARRERVSA